MQCNLLLCPITYANCTTADFYGCKHFTVQLVKYADHRCWLVFENANLSAAKLQFTPAKLCGQTYLD